MSLRKPFYFSLSLSVVDCWVEYFVFCPAAIISCQLTHVQRYYETGYTIITDERTHIMQRQQQTIQWMWCAMRYDTLMIISERVDDDIKGIFFNYILLFVADILLLFTGHFTTKCLQPTSTPLPFTIKKRHRRINHTNVIKLINM